MLRGIEIDHKICVAACQAADQGRHTVTVWLHREDFETLSAHYKVVAGRLGTAWDECGHMMVWTPGGRANVRMLEPGMVVLETR